MNNDNAEFLEKRELFALTPDRYRQVPSISSVRQIILDAANKWKTSRDTIAYADVGCGSGEGTSVFSDFLKKQTGLGVKAVGIDASKTCELECKQKGLDYMQLDIGTQQIPLGDLQVVTLFETIEHIFNTDFLLKSIRTTMASDGLLFISTLNVVCLKNRILVPLGIQPMNTEVSTIKLSYGYRLNSLKKKVDAWQPAGHIRPFTLYSLCDLVEANGFTVTKTFGLENWKGLKFLEKVSKNMCTGILIVAKPKP